MKPLKIRLCLYSSLFILLAIFLAGCETREVPTDCGILNCLPIKNSVYLSTFDANGKPAKPKYIEIHNLRSGEKQINLQDSRDYIGEETFKYKLFSRTRDFSSGGDKINVLVRSETGKEYILEYLIKGGNCTCDIEKIYGPDKLVMD
ncbi:MAG: hypothetical protein EOO07_23935 [Chitinophagaceae bacterium]|nr:MAG: hypothetical protein EOO07_23935 [Chitinophagaceae bacterium]